MRIKKLNITAILKLNHKRKEKKSKSNLQHREHFICNTFEKQVGREKKTTFKT
jgi:hypothetical protein